MTHAQVANNLVVRRDIAKRKVSTVENTYDAAVFRLYLLLF